MLVYGILLVAILLGSIAIGKLRSEIRESSIHSEIMRELDLDQLLATEGELLKKINGLNDRIKKLENVKKPVQKKKAKKKVAKKKTVKKATKRRSK